MRNESSTRGSALSTGWAELSVRQIAEAGTAKPKIYRHFTDKSICSEGYRDATCVFMLAGRDASRHSTATDSATGYLWRREYVNLRVDRTPTCCGVFTFRAARQSSQATARTLNEGRGPRWPWPRCSTTKLRETEFESSALELAAMRRSDRPHRQPSGG